MKTSYYYKAMMNNYNGNYVSISRGKMKGCENMLEYKALMPSWEIINLAHRLGYNELSFYKYRDAYFEQLDKLDAIKVWKDLKNCTLVCYESARDIKNGAKFCHRRMVAGWLEEKLGIKVLEDGYESVKAIFRNTMYTDRF